MKVLTKSIFLTSVCLIILSCEKHNDFDVICSYFDKLDQKSKSTGESADEKFAFVNGLIIENLSTNSTAREAWNAVMSYEPAEGRYGLFKESAEVTLGDSWDCASMQSQLPGM